MGPSRGPRLLSLSRFPAAAPTRRGRHCHARPPGVADARQLGPWGHRSRRRGTHWRCRWIVGVTCPRSNGAHCPPRCTAATIACAVSYQLIVSDVHVTAPSQSRRPGAQERPRNRGCDRTSCPSTRFPPDEHCHPPCVPPGSAPAFHRDRYIAVGGGRVRSASAARVIAREQPAAGPRMAAGGARVEACAEEVALFSWPSTPPATATPPNMSPGGVALERGSPPVAWGARAASFWLSKPPLLP